MNIISHQFDEFCLKNEERIDYLASETKNLCSSEISKNLLHDDSDKKLQTQFTSDYNDIIGLHNDQYYKSANHLENHLQVLVHTILNSLEINQFL